MNITRYLHTMRYLRPVQVYGRVWHKLKRVSPDMRSAPPLREPSGVWIAPIKRPPCMLGPDLFRFLNFEQTVCPGCWNGPAPEKLWLLNLHYFDDLTAEHSERREGWHRALIARWIAENPPGEGIGWQAYALSLRIVNWIKWHLAGNRLDQAALDSLAVQIRYLSRTVESYLLGNHLLANGKALTFAGAFFAGPEAEGWLNQGMQLLAQEFAEEILPDGGHFERSPMYHSIILEDVIDLCNLAQAYPDLFPTNRWHLHEAWTSIVKRMRVWLKAMCHPDGKIAFFNDAAWQIAPTEAQIDAYAHRMGFGAVPGPKEGITDLKASGFIRLQQGETVALLDVGPIGPDYSPGHAHADTLSFELSVKGRRTIVNSGTSTYKIGPQRYEERSTRAHSTVSVDDADSSEVWSSFRVARRARPFDLIVSNQGAEILVRCAHNGYRRLKGRVTHRRAWRFYPGGLEIQDTLEGHYSNAVARFYLHPEVRVQKTNGSLIMQAERHRLTCAAVGERIGVETAEFHPEFGLSVPTSCLTVKVAPKDACVRLEWDPLTP